VRDVNTSALVRLRGIVGTVSVHPSVPTWREKNSDPQLAARFIPCSISPCQERRSKSLRTSFPPSFPVVRKPLRSVGRSLVCTQFRPLALRILCFDRRRMAVVDLACPQPGRSWLIWMFHNSAGTNMIALRSVDPYALLSWARESFPFFPGWRGGTHTWRAICPLSVLRDLTSQRDQTTFDLIQTGTRFFTGGSLIRCLCLGTDPSAHRCSVHSGLMGTDYFSARKEQ
jgi:hypothetical protein